MAEPSSQEAARETNGQHEAQARDGFDELRRLLLRPEQQQLSEIETRLQDRSIDPEEMSQVLPEAISRRPQPDRLLTSALMPAVEEAVKESVNRDPSPLTDAIFPIIGPAIRKSIAQALQSMVQSLQQTLEHSLSVRSLRWRFEAFRTGKSFAEVVLLHTLLFRVEQVFFIHRETGLLLHHVLADTVTAYEPEAVSGMMTAIQDFVRDAFHVNAEDTLETFQVGELTVWIEQGRHAYLAVVIRGNPLQEIRSIFQDALAELHLKYGDALASFDGDTAPLATCEPILATCLISQSAEAERSQKPSPLMWLGLGLVLAVILFVIGNRVLATWRWNHYVQQLRGIPGIVVTQADAYWWSYQIKGLRDPLAVDPRLLLAASKVPADSVVSVWEPYQALYPAFILQRARQALNPPKTVTLRLQDETLIASGQASREWLLKARQIAPVIAGVTQWREEKLTEIQDQ